MKKLLVVTGALLTAGLLFFPMMASAGDDGKHTDKMWEKMWDDDHDWHAAGFTPEQWQQINALRLKFRTDNAEAVTALKTKNLELHSIFNSFSPDLAKASAVKSEITALEAGLDQKSLALFAEIQKINPNVPMPYWHH